MSATALRSSPPFAILLLCAVAPFFAVYADRPQDRFRAQNDKTGARQEALAKGEALLKSRNYREAVNAFRSVLTTNPQDPRALYGTALALFNLKRLAEAEPMAKAAADILVPPVWTRPRSATREARLRASDALVLQAVIHAVSGNDAAALKSAELAAEISPGHFDAQFTYGRALFGAGNASEAVKAFRRAVNLRPTDTQALFFLGTTLEGTGDLEGAIKTYRQIIANDPQAAEGHLGVGILLVRRIGAEGEEGIAELERALTIDGRLYEARVAVGRALLTRGRVNQAVDHLVRAVELNPGNPEPHYQLSLAYRRLGLTEKAERETAAVRRIHDARRSPNIQSSSQTPRVAN